MHTIQTKSEPKLVVKVPKARNLDLHNARFSRKAGRCDKNEKARGAQRRADIEAHQ